MALNGVDAVRNLTHNGRGVTRAGTYFKDILARLHLGGLYHQSDDVRL